MHDHEPRDSERPLPGRTVRLAADTGWRPARITLTPRPRAWHLRISQRRSGLLSTSAGLLPGLLPSPNVGRDFFDRERLEALWLESTTEPGQLQCAFVDGFSLHAATFVPPHDHAALERLLLRYILRPAIATDRVSLRDDGRGELRFRIRRDRAAAELPDRDRVRASSRRSACGRAQRAARRIGITRGESPIWISPATSNPKRW